MNLQSTNQPQHLFGSHLYDHSKNQKTDYLYDPLRNVTSHPNQIDHHQIETQHAMQRSRVTHNYKHLSSREY